MTGTIRDAGQSLPNTSQRVIAILRDAATPIWGFGDTRPRPQMCHIAFFRLGPESRFKAGIRRSWIVFRGDYRRFGKLRPMDAVRRDERTQAILPRQPSPQRLIAFLRRNAGTGIEEWTEIGWDR